jgi:hypothetical protein
MRMKDLIDYYSRDDIQQAMLEVARDREVVGVFRNGSFAKRPNTIQYPEDIVSMIRQGVMEFHCSIERWSRPMALKQDNYAELRKGWDMILDLDCKVFEHGKTAALVLCRALEKHDIKGYSVKFTGGKGFHVGIPWESIPSEVNYEPVANQFPDLARNIALYLKDFAREDLERELLKRFGTPEKIAEQMKVPLGKIMATGKAGEKQMLDPYKVVDIDPVLISPRHLFRMPYSLHKGSFLVSLPLRHNELELFDKGSARPDRVKPDIGFLNGGKEGEGEVLVGETIDWHTRKGIVRKSARPVITGPQYALKRSDFPPCIQNILKGLTDGKKRSIFILTNFFSSAGWKLDSIEKELMEWNKKNRPPMRENYVRTHVRWHEGRIRSGQKKLPPPGCNKEGYYVSIGVCKPDDLCGGQAKTIKNPLNYAVKKDGMKKAKGKPKGKGRKREKTIYIE